MVQSPLSSPLLLILRKRDCCYNTQLNHYTQSWMIFAESSPWTSENLFPPISHSWLFSTNHGYCPTSWDAGSLSIAAMFPYTRSQSHPMKFLFRVAIIHSKMERTGSSFLSSLVPSYIHSLKTCVESLLHTNIQVENFQTCKSTFACAITSLSSQIWHTLS